jgi:protein TonB
MNVAQPRSSIWSPPVVLLAIVVHVAIFYFVAVSFRIVPPPDDFLDPPTFQTVTFQPPPPIVEPDPIIEKPPRFRPHDPIPSPHPVQVPPIPFPPQPAVESTADAGVISLDRTIEEQPVSQTLPRYPVAAQERGIEGRVIMSITIMPDGSVRDVRVVSAQPRGTFESTAVRAVQSWRYRPSSVTRTNVIVHMDFELRDT